MSDIETKKLCYNVVSSVETLFAYEKKFSVTCESVKYEGDTVMFWSDNETKLEASFCKPLSVEYDTSASFRAGLSSSERMQLMLLG